MSDSFQCQVVVLAAGKGTRMKSELPKVLHRVCGRSLVHRAVHAAAGLKPRSITVVVGYGEQLLREELDKLKTQDFLKGIEVKVAVQAEQLGTGHAVQMAEPQLDQTSPVLVMPGDCPLITTEDLAELAKHHIETKSALSFLTAVFDDAAGFGRVVRGKSGEVLGIVEKKDCTPEQLKIGEINSSIYIFDAALLRQGLGTLKASNAQGEYYLTDTVDFAVKQGKKVEAVCLKNSDAVLGANDRAELSELETKRRRAINKRLMEQGVTLEDPNSTYIDEDVVIGNDSFIGAGTRLRGKTVLGAKVVIDGNSYVTDTSIGDGTRIKYSCVLDSSSVGASCEIGPFAHLRPDSKLKDKVKIGNFVETKKTVMEKGSKANHLTYLGDATVGENSNIGAGTITCNYDGVNKSKTEIEADVFIGSNSALVAPIRIGKGAYVGAGSVITKEVPPGALGIGRSSQNNIEGWVSRKKSKSTKG